MVNAVDETADFVKRYHCGFVSEPSPESMAPVMEQAAATPLEILQDMGKRARKMAEENFSWPIIGDAYADLVRSVVKRYRERMR
jgi:glycosyltransferase involved in cell wall biosynthesis